MEKVSIRHVKSGVKEARIANNLLSITNQKIMLKLLTLQEKYLQNYNLDGREKLYDLNTEILDNFYRMIENTNCKNNLIKNHNNNFKYSRDLSKLCGSVPAIDNAGESLKSDRSKDVVSSDFRKCINALEDEKMQKVAFWANKIAHAGKDEIATFTEQFLGETRGEKELERKKSMFTARIAKANTAFNSEPTYQFNQNALFRLVDGEDFDFATNTNPDFLKAKALMKAKNIPCRNKLDIKSFIYCNKIQNMNNNFFAFKDNAVNNLILHLNDPQIDEDDKNIMAFRIKDNKMTNMKDENLSRIVLANKTMYDIYLKYNDSVNFTDKHIENYLPDKNNDKDKKREIKEIFKEKFDTRCISPNIMNGLMEKCSVSSFHVVDKTLDKFLDKTGAVIEDSCPPIVECMAFNGGNIYDIAPSIEKEDGLSEFLESQEKLNSYNEKKYEGNYERMYSERKIETKAKRIVDNIKTTGVIGGN